MPQQQAPVQPTLVVIEGRRTGQRVGVPPGQSTIGREPGCTTVFDDHGVSRRHAAVTRSHGAVTIVDLGSTNGTWVNGVRVSSPRELVAGDQVRIGSVLLWFDRADAAQPAPTSAHPVPPVASSGAPPSARPVTRPRRRVSIGRVVLVGGIANLVLLAAGVAIAFLTDWTGIGAWLAAPLVGMVAALVDLGKQAMTREPAPTPAPPATPSAPADAASAPAALPGQPAGATAPIPDRPTLQAARPRRRMSIVVGILVAVLVIGAGGAAVAYGVSTVTSFITGNQAGTDRLVGGPISVDTAGVTTTVERIEHTADFTRVELIVRNGLANTISLPVYGNATLAGADGTTLEADPFRSSWSETIAPGQQRRGVIVFGGHLGDAATTASLAFATVFEQGFTGPSSILVEGLVIASLDG